MVSTIDIAAYIDALVFLGTASVIVPILRRWGVSPVLGYLGAGAVLGPLGLGSLSNAVPVLSWFTIGDAQNVAGIAKLGIVFLLFLIGLELSLPRLSAMRRLIVGLGGSQVLLTSAVIAGAAMLAGRNPPEAIVLGASLSLSSTAIVLEILSNQERLTTSVGRASFSVLLAQDLAVIPILLFVSILAARSGGSVLASLASALLQAAVAVTVIALFSRLLLRPLFRLVAGARSSELFIAAVLFVIVAAGVVADQAGLSMALGAFIAGLLLAETEYRKAIEATVGPFKGLLLGVFFFTVGMNIDFRELSREPLWLAGGVVSLIAAKSLLLVGLGRAIPAALAGCGRDRAPARTRRRIRLCRHRHGGGRGRGRWAARELRSRRHLRDHGADAAPVACGPAFRAVAQIGRTRGCRVDGAAGGRGQARDRRWLRPRRQGRVRAP